MLTNPRRILYLDAARGFTVLIMPAVHTVLLYSQPTVYTSCYGLVLTFFSEGPGAQLFMLLMGMGIVLAKPKRVSAILQRGVLLLLAGYLLNLCRLVLPALAGVLPPTLTAAYAVYPKSPVWSFLLTGDILQFAGLAYVCCALLARSKHVVAATMVLYLLVPGASVYWRNLQGPGIFWSHITGLLFAADYRAFFPVFPWLCYPLAGLAAGRWLQQSGQDRFAREVWIAGLVCMVSGQLLLSAEPAAWDGDFYRAGPSRSLLQTGFVFLWIGLMAILTRFFGGSAGVRLLCFCSRHITVIYVLQWIIISWGTGLAGYQTLNTFESVVASLLTTGASLGATQLFVNRRQLIQRLGRNKSSQTALSSLPQP